MPDTLGGESPSVFIMVDINVFAKSVRGEVRSGMIRRRRWSLEEKGRDHRRGEKLPACSIAYRAPGRKWSIATVQQNDLPWGISKASPGFFAGRNLSTGPGDRRAKYSSRMREGPGGFCLRFFYPIACIHNLW